MIDRGSAGSVSETPADLVAVVGSLRRASVNAAVARAAVSVATRASLTIHEVSDVPFYDGDVEVAGLPPAVERLNDAVAASDGLLLFSPEYNSSFPAVTKNVIDWLSRPPKVWEELPIGLVTATPGSRGARRPGALHRCSRTPSRQALRDPRHRLVGRQGRRRRTDRPGHARGARRLRRPVRRVLSRQGLTDINPSSMPAARWSARQPARRLVGGHASDSRISANSAGRF